MKKTLLATSALALIAATAGAVDVEMYGQVNKAVLGYDDGANTDVVIVDNEYSTTRAGLKGAQALDNGLTASALFEFEASDNNSQQFTQNSRSGSTGTQTTPANSPASFNQRQARVGLSGNFGGVYVGRQSVATDGVLGADLAGAQDVMGQDVTSIGGGLRLLRTGSTTSATIFSNSPVVNTMATGFADERANSIRYDSPIFAGIQGRASIQQGGDMDLSAFYDGAMGDFKIAGAAGIQFNNDGTTPAANSNTVKSEYGASLSVAHSTGLAATVAYSTQDLDRKAANANEGETLYGKVGYAWDAFEVAADYGTSKNYRVRTGDDELKAFGLAGQYNLGHGVSVAGLYRNFDADITGASTDSIDLYGVNMRVKF
ncbi:MAG: porin [Alphaproteobacteria bacterium]|nr:porin [Alphaproteobacteria bacterium]